MTKVIVYNQLNCVAAIIRPTQEALDIYGIEAIAKKDVPSGFKYAIVDADLIPSDRSQREAWTIDDADLIDGVGGESSTFDEVTE